MVRRILVFTISLNAHLFCVPPPPPVWLSTDMSTMENLWLKYSSGKFGYSVQRDLWRKTKGDFENFCRRIGWTTTDSEVLCAPVIIKTLDNVHLSSASCLQSVYPQRLVAKHALRYRLSDPLVEFRQFITMDIKTSPPTFDLFIIQAFADVKNSSNIFRMLLGGGGAFLSYHSFTVGRTQAAVVWCERVHLRC